MIKGLKKKPVFVDQRFKQIFEQEIVKPLENPGLWDQELIPIKRLFLLYGQKGNSMESGLYSLIEKHGIQSRDFKITDNKADVIQMFLDESKEQQTQLLVIRKGHLLQWYRALFTITDHLKELGTSLFIIVISEDIPKDDEPFWVQFKHRIPYGVPPTSFHHKLLSWYFKKWEQHWPYSKVDVDLDWLSKTCDYCTQSDVKKFTRKIFRLLNTNYQLGTNLDITRELLEDPNNELMYPSLGIPGLLCITQIDSMSIQSKYDPEGNNYAPSIQESEERATKRLKSVDPDPDSVAPTVYIEGSGGSDNGNADVPTVTDAVLE